MIRVCTILGIFACIDLSTTFSDEYLPQRMIIGERAINNADFDWKDQPLFDFPISRALGIEIEELATLPIRRPSIDDVVADADDSDDIKAAEAPIVYYDAPRSYHRPRSIWR